jgi:hypothetical protein
MKKTFLLFCLILILGGCSRTFTNDQLIGKYEILQESGTDIIELNSNEIYKHIYKQKNGVMYQQSGKWNIEQLDSGSTVVLNNFHYYNKDDLYENIVEPNNENKPNDNLSTGAYNLLLIKSYFGDIKLITNIDLNEGYEKVSNGN